MNALFRAWVAWMKRRGSWKMVRRNGEDYLERFYLLRLRGRALFLHRFWSSDPDAPHDHPWPWCSIVLTRGYAEHGIGVDDAKIVRPLRVNRHEAQTFHRIRVREEDRGEVWTLFYHGRRERAWGFLQYGRWVSARVEGAQDDREMRGWLFPRFVGEEVGE